MNVFCAEAILAGEQRWLHKGGLLRIGIDRLETRVTAEEDLALFLQLGQPFQARGRLRLVHDRSYLYFWIPGITHFHGAQTCRDGIAKGFELLARNQDAPDGRALLSGFDSHFAHHPLSQTAPPLRPRT